LERALESEHPGLLAELGAGPVADFQLCGWLVAGLALFLARPLPTLPHYFILVVPFVSILAAL
jgi:hypothetical protein